MTQEHLATLSTRFSPSGVLPALGLGQGRLRLRCGLPMPCYVFLDEDSTYRSPCSPDGTRWHRDAAFQPVKRMIQKFQKLLVFLRDSLGKSKETQRIKSSF